MLCGNNQVQNTLISHTTFAIINIMKYLFYILTVLVTTLYSPPASANILDVEIEVSNNFPEPGEEVQIKTSRQITSGDFLWIINGKEQTSLQGRNNISITAGKAGDLTLIQIVHHNRVVTQSIIFPIYIDIAIEPNTYIPQHYQGRSLPSSNSTIRLTALVDDGSGLDQEYFYVWRMNGQTINNNRGVDRSVEVRTPIASSVNISLSITKPGTGFYGRRNISISLEKPKVHFYTHHSLYGTLPFIKENNFQMSQGEILIYGAPYYLPMEILSNPDNIRWRVDNRAINNSTSNPLILRYQRSSNNRSSTVRLNISSITDIILQISDSVRINN